MDSGQIIGIIASALTAGSLIPQLIKVIRDQKTEGISFIMFLVLFSGHSLWIAYGVVKEDWIIIISNAFALLIDIAISIATVLIKRKGNPGKA